MTYSVRRLAAGSYDVLLNGCLVASLVREIDHSGTPREWLVDLLDEVPPATWPAPFTAQQHAFASQAAALKWLGIRGADASGEPSG
ncbi:hypothetical protein MMSR116_17820 [Methylobacterium mesophilicum SR1.6/6]|uniref:Uncharacterized protein n=1 Tax=Methylobacterium mesophilicum SR1.6/6 TaxID=908290 RepID=A0A6B9FP75_9HYPH|nr:hypothetical protein [Methylobacterium mesophilicum]QGY03536.1 hypothetical protein MMSR116_17820 [Methylobacterium mesophilicum SR1.6/6]